MKPLLVKTAHSSGGWKVKVVESKPSPLLSKSTSSSSHGTLRAASENSISLSLSQKRAEAIKQFLIEQGSIDQSRITAIGYGSASPIRFPELTEEDLAQRINLQMNYKKKYFGGAVKKEEIYQNFVT